MTATKLHRVADLKEFLGLSIDSCRRLVREKKIKAFRPSGRIYMIRDEDLQAFIESRSNQPQAAATDKAVKP